MGYINLFPALAVLVMRPQADAQIGAYKYIILAYMPCQYQGTACMYQYCDSNRFLHNEFYTNVC